MEAICIFVGFKTLSWPDRLTWSHLLNNIFIICCFCAIVTFPFYIVLYYICNKRKFQEDTWCESFIAKYGIFYGLLKKNEDLLPRYAVVFLYSYFVFRRLIWALVFVFLAHKPGIQIAILLLTCFIAFGYWVTYMPFEAMVYNVLHIINEVVLIILLNLMWWYSYMMFFLV